MNRVAHFEMYAADPEGLAWWAHGKDPDGNVFGVYQEDPPAR
jgi:predicted enzyme related to lactoylglutathione lyase